MYRVVVTEMSRDRNGQTEKSCSENGNIFEIEIWVFRNVLFSNITSILG